MNRIDTKISGVSILEPRVFSDDRGCFWESWNSKILSQLGINETFVQDNHSCSSRGVLRGLHYQVELPQGKLIRCVSGSIFDVCVDIRRESPTFGKYVGLELSASNRRQLWVPGGMAHGFLVLTDTADVIYKVTNYWSKNHERGIRWDDPGIGIEWPLGPSGPVVNSRDLEFPRLANIPGKDLL